MELKAIPASDAKVDSSAAKEAGATTGEALLNEAHDSIRANQQHRSLPTLKASVVFNDRDPAHTHMPQAETPYRDEFKHRIEHISIEKNTCPRLYDPVAEYLSSCTTRGNALERRLDQIFYGSEPWGPYGMAPLWLDRRWMKSEGKDLYNRIKEIGEECNMPLGSKDAARRRHEMYPENK